MNSEIKFKYPIGYEDDNHDLFETITLLQDILVKMKSYE